MVLTPGGHYKIADKSRDLNDKLGRKRVTEEEVKKMVNKAGLTNQAGVEKEGGLWLLIRKQKTRLNAGSS